MAQYNAKPGVDWHAIRSQFESGEKLRDIAKQWGITHKAIQKRRDKEGWNVKAALYNAATKLPSVIAQATGLATTTVRTEDKARVILESLQKGLPEKVCASQAGISLGAFKLWQEQDESFNALCDAATDSWHATKLANIDKAGDRGDWKADAYRLERHHKTRETYATKGDAGTNITVVLNIDRSEPTPITIEGKVSG